ncbi:MAG: PadR family transcriptional regulator [Anaerolineales bacterium]|jgi:DNA-binding PadR family transcriptional regulator
MTKIVPDPENFLPLTPAVFHILLALSDSEKHGYAIMRVVEETTGGRMILGPGTLYGAVKRLLKRGLIVESDIRPDPVIDDSRRRYYRLTDLGREVLTAESERLAELVKHARRKDLLGPENTRLGEGA